MNSFIIACQSDDIEENNSIDLYLNFFKKNKDMYLKQQVYIDVGIKIKDTNRIKNIAIFLPFICETEDIIDLFSEVTEDKFLTVLYNSGIRNKLCDNNFCSFRFLNDREEFFFRIINYMQIIKKEKFHDSTMTKICIDLSSAVNEIKESTLASHFNNEMNFRFRIITKDLGEIIKKSKNNKLASIFSPNEYTITQILDFRFNYIRSLDADLISKLGHDKLRLVRFDKIRFSTIEPLEYIIDNFCSIYYKARILEDDIWNNYIGGDHEYIENMISYSWDFFEEKAEKFQVMYRRSSKKINIIFVLLYLCLTLFTGVIASYLVWIITQI